jgi:uncharacterized membrane protein
MPVVYGMSFEKVLKNPTRIVLETKSPEWLRKINLRKINSGNPRSIVNSKGMRSREVVELLPQ